MSESSYSVFNAMADIVAAPAQAYDEIRSRTSWLWWALLASIGLACLLFVYYYSWVDFEWLVEDTIRNLPAERRAEAADGVRQFMQPGRSTLFTVGAIIVMTLVIYTVQSVYLHLANKMTTGADIGFGQWFSFTTWSFFVNVFGSLSVFAVILMADGNQLSQTDLQPLSLNTLLIQAAPDEPWFRWGSSLSLINFWIFFLMTVGWSRWTGSSMGKSAAIVLLPWVVIFGVWALMI